MNECFNCGSKHLRQVENTLTRKIAGHAFRAKVPALECKSCGEMLYSSEDLGRFDDAVAMALIDAGTTAPEAMRFIRKALGLPAQDLAVLIGVRPETVSRWETGRRAIDRPMLVILRQLLLERRSESHPMTDLLRQLQKPRRLGKTVAIKMAS